MSSFWAGTGAEGGQTRGNGGSGGQIQEGAGGSRGAGGGAKGQDSIWAREGREGSGKLQLGSTRWLKGISEVFMNSGGM